MEVSPKTQIAELIRNSHKLLILTHKDPDGDAIGSACALARILKKIEKEVDVVINGDLPDSFGFLPNISYVKTEIENSNDITISIDTRSTGNNLTLGQKKLPEEQRLLIVVSPMSGKLSPEDIIVTNGRKKYDAVIILDCSTAQRIGGDSARLEEIFQESPTVNIDHHPGNGYFAKINWVDTAASSTAEMLVSLCESIGRGENLLDSEIATCLLTGIITDTGSFQNQSTTSKSLTVAAQLVAAGARQQEIIEKVMRTKPLTTLRLWGRILSNMEEHGTGHFAFAAITDAEIKELGAHPKQLSGLIDEMMKTAADMDFVMLISERDGNTHCSLRSVAPKFDVSRIARAFGGGGHVAAAAFELEGSPSNNKDKIIQEALRATAR